MQDGKKNSLLKQYSNKKILYLGIAWGAVLITVLVIGILMIAQVDQYLISAIALILLLVLVFVIIHCKVRISFYDMHYRYHKLLALSNKADKTTCRFNNDWLDSLRKLGYTIASDQEKFVVYYRFADSISRRSITKTKILEIVTIIRDNVIDSYDDRIDAVYKKLWLTNYKTNKLSSQVILQFRKYKSFNEDIKNDLDKIIAYKERSNYLVSINCGYFEDNQLFYYLHSDQYSPNLYYQYANDRIKTIISL